jgi:hypothetical protein
MKSKRILQTELRQAGASKSETAELAQVATQLKVLSTHAVVPVSRPNWYRRLLPLSMASVAGLLIGAMLIAYAQTSLPGSWTYPVKKLSEQAAVLFDSNYRATLMMRRSQEVRELIHNGADQQIVLATLLDYQHEAAAYKSTNYAAFEYCKSNLVQAAGVAPATERSAIRNALSSLQT